MNAGPPRFVTVPLRTAVLSARLPRAMPRATLRLQLHRGFGFDHAAAQLPYLARLGISHVYVSPILSARVGSTHGYDVVDPTRVSEELGGEEGLRRLVARLREHDMGLIVDIVPNHMAVGGDDNPWWLDVLQWGRNSVYARFFDIDWDVPDTALRGRVLAPFLGKPYGEALADGDLRLQVEADRGRLYVQVHGMHRFPLAPESYGSVLRGQGETFLELACEFQAALQRRASLPARRAAFDALTAKLAARLRAPAAHRAIEQLIEAYSPASTPGRLRLHRLLERQHYRIAWWRTAPDEINWRRFFDISDLAGLRIQDAGVFEAVHATIFRLYAAGLIDGLRVDHVDGLADPRAYCRKLRRRLEVLGPGRPPELARTPAYLVVEKILATGELLARDWRTDGTSGYAFMNEANAVLHDARGRDALGGLWRAFGGQSADFHQTEQEARRRIPQHLFAADFHACAHALHQVAREDPMTRDWSLAAIRRILAEILVHFPVYRIYADGRGRSPADAAIMARVVEQVQRSCRPAELALVSLVDGWLGGEPPQDLPNAPSRRLRLRAIARFQQLTSPVAAKSLEDTAFYRFGVLLSRNEVGANPAQFAMSIDEFHRACIDRQRRYPYAMLATATHDHKRGEDLRARLAVLSEIPGRWAETVMRWRMRNEPAKSMVSGALAPDAIDEYVLYQMIVGAWPLGLAPDDVRGLREFADRLSAWQLKAVREAKRVSGWIEPNLAYEGACDAFLRGLLDPARPDSLVPELAAWVDELALPGAVNGLSQTLLRLSTPGLPDTYQGTEFWDFSLVDPDNRRDVDFAARRAALDETPSDTAVLAHWRDGRIKQQLMARMLALRARRPSLFAAGHYTPLRVHGLRADRVLAFLREQGDDALLIAVPLHTAGFCRQGRGMQGALCEWDDTAVELPQRWRLQAWRDALGSAGPVPAGRELRLAALMADWPLCIREVVPAPQARPRHAMPD